MKRSILLILLCLSNYSIFAAVSPKEDQFPNAKNLVNQSLPIVPTDLTKIILDYCKLENYELSHTITCTSDIKVYNEVRDFIQKEDNSLVYNEEDLIKLNSGLEALINQNKIIIFLRGENKLIHLQDLTGHTNIITSLIKLKNGNMLSYSLDGTMKIWTQNLDLPCFIDDLGNVYYQWYCKQTLLANSQLSGSQVGELENGDIASYNSGMVTIWKTFDFAYPKKDQISYTQLGIRSTPVKLTSLAASLYFIYKYRKQIKLLLNLRKFIK